jgi:phage shock protein A
MATCKKVKHQLDDAKSREAFWGDRAQLAVDKGREDLAREALHEKRRYTHKAEMLDAEMTEHSVLVEKYQDDIRQLEDKLGSAREKQRLLLQRYIQVNGKKRAQEEIRRMESTEAILKFEEFEDRIDQMEAEAELVNYGKKSGLNEKFDELLADEDIEKELAALKKKVQGEGNDTAE